MQLDSASKSTDKRGRSLFYASPEKISGSHDKNSWEADVWALTLVITEIVLKAASIPKGWSRITNSEHGLGKSGPASSLHSDNAIKFALSWVLSPCTAASLPQLLPYLITALRRDPSERGTAADLRKAIARNLEEAGMHPHCGSQEISFSSDDHYQDASS